MTTLYSLDGTFPAELPVFFLDADGNNYTALDERSDEDLAVLGFQPAPAEPDYNADTHALTWDEDKWVTTAYTDEELSARLVSGKNDAKASVTDEFRLRVELGVVVGGVSYSSSYDGERDLDVAAETLGDDTINVVTRSQSQVSLTASGASTARDAVRAYRRACQEREGALYALIDDKTDIAEVRAIDVTAGWP